MKVLFWQIQNFHCIQVCIGNSFVHVLKRADIIQGEEFEQLLLVEEKARKARGT